VESRGVQTQGQVVFGPGKSEVGQKRYTEVETIKVQQVECRDVLFAGQVADSGAFS
jgi:hypothetical protein